MNRPCTRETRDAGVVGRPMRRSNGGWCMRNRVGTVCALSFHVSYPSAARPEVVLSALEDENVTPLHP